MSTLKVSCRGVKWVGKNVRANRSRGSWDWGQKGADGQERFERLLVYARLDTGVG